MISITNNIKRVLEYTIMVSDFSAGIMTPNSELLNLIPYDTTE